MNTPLIIMHGQDNLLRLFLQDFTFGSFEVNIFNSLLKIIHDNNTRDQIFLAYNDTLQIQIDLCKKFYDGIDNINYHKIKRTVQNEKEDLLKKNIITTNDNNENVKENRKKIIKIMGQIIDYETKIKSIEEKCHAEINEYLNKLRKNNHNKV